MAGLAYPGERAVARADENSRSPEAQVRIRASRHGPAPILQFRYLCKELGIERVTLYRYVGPKGELRDHAKRLLGLT